MCVFFWGGGDNSTTMDHFPIPYGLWPLDVNEGIILIVD